MSPGIRTNSRNYDHNKKSSGSEATGVITGARKHKHIVLIPKLLFGQDGKI